MSTQIVDCPLGPGLMGGESVADRLMASDMDVDALRPWRGEDRRTYVTVNKGQDVITQNAGGFLRKGDWEAFDKVVIEESQSRLQGVADLRSRGLEYTVTDGLGKMVLESETASAFNEATVGMEPSAAGTSDRSHFGLLATPLPCIWKPFDVSLRQLRASQSGGSPIDTLGVRLATRSVLEQAEKLLTGTADKSAFMNLPIYGFTNLSGRQSQTLTDPAGGGWTGETLLNEILAAIVKLEAVNHYGPYRLYFSKDWRKYLDRDYKASTGTSQSSISTRMRIAQVDGIEAIKTIDFLPALTVIVAQATEDVMQIVVGLEPTVVQWDGMGGLSKHWLVMAILVPRLRLDHAGQAGICECKV